VSLAAPGPSPRLGVAVILVRGRGAASRFLLLKRATRSFFGEWASVEGGLEPGEDAVRAAVRELREETGLAPARLYRLAPAPRSVPGERGAVRLHVFVGFARRGARVMLNGEHSEYAWLPPRRAIRRLRFPAPRQALREAYSRFVLADPPEALRVPLSGDPSLRS
jgi:dihydroneopterin triphosphate diphosphatase